MANGLSPPRVQEIFVSGSDQIKSTRTCDHSYLVLGAHAQGLSGFMVVRTDLYLWLLASPPSSPTPRPRPQACPPCVQLPLPHTPGPRPPQSSLPSQQKVPSLLYSCSTVDQASIFHSTPRDPSVATFQCALAAPRFLQWTK